MKNGVERDRRVVKKAVETPPFFWVRIETEYLYIDAAE